MKVLFLDIDGVLNSVRTAIAHEGFPFDFSEKGMGRFDHTSIALIQKLCRLADVKVVLSSTWRLSFTVVEVSEALGLPVIDRTKSLAGNRGTEIQEWLDRHPEVEQYAILDDNSDMLDSQANNFVQTSGDDGLTLKNFRQLCALFGVSEYARDDGLILI